jgi:hypothetical protein
LLFYLTLIVVSWEILVLFDRSFCSLSVEFYIVNEFIRNINSRSFFPGKKLFIDW